jgi:hypothetical protein
MSTPEDAGRETMTSGTYIISYMDGRRQRVERINRPGVVLRLERTYPDVDLDEIKTKPRLEYLLFMVWTALLIDHPEGDPQRPADDLQQWADTLADLDDEADVGPTMPAESELVELEPDRVAP